MTGDVKLSVSNVGFDAPPKCDTPYSLHATFKNESTKVIANVPLGFVMKGSSNLGSANLSNLAPGASQTVSITPPLPFDGSVGEFVLFWDLGAAFSGVSLFVEYGKATATRACTLDVALE